MSNDQQKDDNNLLQLTMCACTLPACSMSWCHERTANIVFVFIGSAQKADEACSIRQTHARTLKV
jgi:hypothetical protein